MITALLALLLSFEASAQDIELDFGGRFQSDLRFRVLTAKDLFYFIFIGY